MGNRAYLYRYPYIDGDDTNIVGHMAFHQPGANMCFSVKWEHTWGVIGIEEEAYSVIERISALKQIAYIQQVNTNSTNSPTKKQSSSKRLWPYVFKKA